MYWNTEIETMDRAALERLQVDRLTSALRRARQAPFYRELYEKRGLGSVVSLADLCTLPFTTKADLRDGFPYGFLAVPLEQVVRLHSSSGTTGNPTVIYHTREDIEAWQDLVARCMYMAGMRRTDVFQNMMGYGLFTGGIGFHYGAEKHGAMTIPIGPGNSRRQIWFMKEFKTTAIHVLPSYALRLATHVEEMGMDPRRDLSLRMAFVGAEPHTEETRKKIEQTWNIRVFNSYGLSEMCGPGVAFECPEQSGMHIWEDHFVVEIVDPETGENLPDGECGELVLTSIARAGTPLLRYRTRDLTRIVPGRCACGRTHRRIDRITGRSDDMLIVRGVNIYPQQIESVLMSMPEIGRNYLIVLEGLDEMTVKVELAAAGFTGQVEQLVHLQTDIANRLRAELLTKPKVELVPPGTLPVSEGKAKRVIDNRKL
jgi:phenylacetate-CoA ligase